MLDPIEIQTELLDMCWENPLSPFLKNNRERVRELGEQLNKIGGYELMFNMYGTMPYCDQRELKKAWHGIGEWLA